MPIIIGGPPVGWSYQYNGMVRYDGGDDTGFTSGHDPYRTITHDEHMIEEAFGPDEYSITLYRHFDNHGKPITRTFNRSETRGFYYENGLRALTQRFNNFCQRLDAVKARHDLQSDTVPAYDTALQL